MPAPIATQTTAGMTVTLDQEMIDLDNTLSHGELSSAEKAVSFPRFWALINVAITNVTKNASHMPRVRVTAEEEDNGRRDEIENGPHEPEERRITREDDSGRRDESENGQGPEDRGTIEANNGRRDDIQGAGVVEQAAHDGCDMHDSSLLDELYNLVVEADNQEQGELSVIPPSTSTSTAHLGARQALSTHTFCPRTDNDLVSGRRKRRTTEIYPTTEK